MDVSPPPRSSHPPLQMHVLPPRRGRRIALGIAVATVLASLGLVLSSSMVASTAPTTYSIFGTLKPNVMSSTDRESAELGVRFKTATPGWITGIRFYMGSQNTGQHTGTLWNSTGKQLANVRFETTTRTGWQQARLSNPIRVQVGGIYTASYRAPDGGYAADEQSLSPSKPKTTNALTALQGVYNYGPGLPTATWHNANYYVDVIFTTTQPVGSTSSTTSTPPPTSSSTSRTATSTSTSTSSSTTSTTTSTSGTAGTCVGAANTPGGPDPWGGCWPGPQNTGYPHGLRGDSRKPVTLTAYTGPTTIRSCGVVIDSKIVNESIIVQAGNGTKSKSTPCVTIRNSLVKGVVYSEQANYGPVLVEDTEVDPPDLPWWENVGRSNIFVYRVNSHGGEGVIKCAVNCEAKDSWVHGMVLGDAYHYNAFGGNGTKNFKIEHNYATCGDWERKASPTSDAGCSAVIGFYGDFGPIEDIAIQRNYLGSTFDMSASGINRQAGYCLNPGYYPGKPYPNTRNLTVTDNVFGRGGSGKCGVFGPTNSLNARGAPNGNVWNKNRYTDGTVIARPEE